MTADFQALLSRSSLAEPVRLVKLLIAGSRSLEPSVMEVSDAVDRLLDYGCGHGSLMPNEIVSGCARGVDRVGEFYAEACGLKLTRFPITPRDWKTYGRSAGPRRNMHMAKYADALLAFWDGVSRGTGDMIRQMRDRGKPALVVEVKR